MKKRDNALLRKTMDVLNKFEKGKVLDLGCGSGVYSNKLKGLGFEVIASDIDVDRFEYSESIEFKYANLDNELPFESDMFDYVLFVEVLEHIKNPYFVLKEINRVLKTGGTLMLSTPNILNITSRIQFLFEGKFDFFKKPTLDYAKELKKENNLTNLHIIVWRYHELEYLLYESNFKIKNFYVDYVTTRSKVLTCLFKPLLRKIAKRKEVKSRRRNSVDMKRINKIINSDQILSGRHIILEVKKK